MTRPRALARSPSSVITVWKCNATNIVKGSRPASAAPARNSSYAHRTSAGSARLESRRHPQRARPSASSLATACDDDRQWARVIESRWRGPSEVDALRRSPAREWCLGGLLNSASRAGRNQLANGSIAVGDPEHHAARRFPVNRRDTRSDNTRMPGDRIYHQRSRMHVFGAA